MEVGDRKLVVQRSSTGPINKGATGVTTLAQILPMASETQAKPTNVLLLLNMVTSEELMNDEDYNEIYEDIHDEASQFGEILKIKIPRPPKPDDRIFKTPGVLTESGQDYRLEQFSEELGVGKIFIAFKDIEACSNALKSLAGRVFGGRTVIGAFGQPEDVEDAPLPAEAPEFDVPPPLPDDIPPPPPE